MTTASTQLLQNFVEYELQNFSIQTVRLESQALIGNPLKDPTTRFHTCLVPKVEAPWPVVLVLAGFSGNGPAYLSPRFNDSNAAQVLDQAVQRGEAPEALYCFVDALTSWGGSQFINSPATGNYEDMIVQELVPALRQQFNTPHDPSLWCVMGGSSGGYGALHLSSKHSHLFGYAAAIAPDSFFEASLLPDYYLSLPYFESCKGQAEKALQDLRSGKLAKKKNFHQILNAFGMAACYGASGSGVQFDFPLNLKTGQKRPEVWNRYLEKDPLQFLPQRIDKLKDLKGLLIDVGTLDNFHLQYGARQITKLLSEAQIPHDYQEFEGNHFDIGERRLEVWKWLSGHWRI